MKYIRTVLFLSLAFIILIPYSSFAQYRSQSYGGEESFSNSVNSWRRQSSALRSKINDLDDDPVEDLPLPVLFGVTLKSVTPNFGDPRNGHAHEGLDIMAAEGLPVVSPTEAVVVRVGDGNSSGNYVTTANPGGESFVYMHLSEVADIDEGDELKPGDIIGYVGHTGNAVASAPHLHFEIHDDDGEATDPYPRITEEFDLEDKIEFLEDILKDADDEEELAELLVTKSRATFTAAIAQDIELPDEITDALETVPTSVSSTSSSNSSVLKVGSRGSAVKDLQEFLVDEDVGSASKVKPDGVFGPITRQALIDYQASVGLVADGVAGPKTLAYIKAHT